MSQLHDPRLAARDPRSRQRSQYLEQLLAHCPEHLFSTDDDELAPIETAAETADGSPVKEAAAKAA